MWGRGPGAPPTDRGCGWRWCSGSAREPRTSPRGVRGKACGRQTWASDRFSFLSLLSAEGAAGHGQTTDTTETTFRAQLGVFCPFPLSCSRHHHQALEQKEREKRSWWGDAFCAAVLNTLRRRPSWVFTWTRDHWRSPYFIESLEEVVVSCLSGVEPCPVCACLSWVLPALLRRALTVTTWQPCVPRPRVRPCSGRAGERVGSLPAPERPD